MLPPAPQPQPHPRPSEAGGVTMMVALMLLVFLTIVSMGMSRNSFREIVASGTVRQGAMAANVADAGIEWAMYWLYPGNVPAPASTSPANLAGPSGLVGVLLATPSLNGQYLPVTNFGSASAPNFYTGPGSQTLASDTSVSNPPSGVTEGFTTALMLMGHLPITNTAQGVSAGSYRPAAGAGERFAPDLWSVRSDGEVKYGGVTFRQSKEGWISTPTR